MIIYATKKTIEDYRVKMPDELVYPVNVIAKSVIEREAGDALLEWGCKSFEFDGVKCIQFANFATKFTVFLIDWEEDDLHNAPRMLINYILKLYEDDEEMIRCVRCMLQETSGVCFSSLKDRSTISVMNRTQREIAWNGYRFYDYISDGIMHTFDINRDVNYKEIVTLTNDELYTGKEFRRQMTERYKDTEIIHFPLGGGMCSCGRRH